MKKFKLSAMFRQIRWKELLAFVVLLLAFVFFRSERHELASIGPQLKNSRTEWVLTGIVLSVIYIILQGLMYVTSFRSAGLALKLPEAVSLFLKRNFLSVFLPAGGVSSLAYLPRNIRTKGYNTASIHQASAVYGFVGLLTVLVVGLPLMVYALFINKNFSSSWSGIAVLGILVFALYGIFISFRKKNALYRFTERKFPKLIRSSEEIFSSEIDRKSFRLTVLISVAIEFCGVFHLLIAMYALGTPASFSAAAISYIVSVVLMIISPFLRGLGAVEFSLTYILVSFGYQHADGLGITLLYRLFEFWLPLLAGIAAYLWSGRKLLARMIPVVMIFFLGIINILSVITPALTDRLHIIKGYLPLDVIHLSKTLTLIAGVLLLVTSAHLFKGTRRAWYFAVAFTVMSVVFNLTKALDYEEALFALATLGLLVYSRKEYILRTKRISLQRGFGWFTGIFTAIFIFNYLSFYFISKSHFGIDFTKEEAFYYTLHTFLLFSDSGLVARTGFARDFQNLNFILGAFSWMILIFSLYRSNIHKSTDDGTEKYEDAENLVEEYGASSLDYFKLAQDKQFFFSEDAEGFVSFRTANGFAVVLEEPVCAAEDKVTVIEEFESYCRKNSLKTCYYRIGEDGLSYFPSAGKQKLFIGQDALLDAENFSLSGKERKSIRNGVNGLEKAGYRTEIRYAPQSDATIDQIQAVSDEWLTESDKKEIVFAEGMFDREVVRNQDLILILDPEGCCVAFLNIIPHCAPDECSYDMIRKKEDAPNGSVDSLIIKLVEYTRSKDLKFINMGMTPMAGARQPDNTAEQLLQLAYERLGSFKHYQSLRNFKEKYADLWENKYLVYNNDLDLLLLPAALNKVMKP